MVICSCPGTGRKCDWEIWRLKTCRPLFRQQPVLVVLAGASTVGEGVDDLELLVPHLVEEQLILVVLLHRRALPHICVTLIVPCKPETYYKKPQKQIFLDFVQNSRPHPLKVSGKLFVSPKNCCLKIYCSK